MREAQASSDAWILAPSFRWGPLGHHRKCLRFGFGLPVDEIGKVSDLRQIVKSFAPANTWEIGSHSVGNARSTNGHCPGQVGFCRERTDRPTHLPFLPVPVFTDADRRPDRRRDLYRLESRFCMPSLITQDVG
jgi:hypothetical protein